MCTANGTTLKNRFNNINYGLLAVCVNYVCDTFNDVLMVTTTTKKLEN